MINNRIFAKSHVLICIVALFALSGCSTLTPAPVYGRDGQMQSDSKDIYVVKSGDTLYSIARENGMDHRELIAMNGIENPNQIAVGRVLKIKPKGVAASPDVATTSPVTTDVVVAQPIGNEPVIENKPLSGNNASLHKREPVAGKEPYSDQALALAQKQEQPKAAEAASSTAKPESSPDAKPSEVAALPGGEEVILIWPSNGKIIGTFNEGGNKGLDIAGKMGDPVIAASDGKVLVANNALRGYGNMLVVKTSSAIFTVYAHNSKLLVKEGQTVTKGQKIAEMGNTDADQVKLHFEVRKQGKPVDPLKYLPPR